MCRFRLETFHMHGYLYSRFCPKIRVLTAAIPENLGRNVQRAKKGELLHLYSRFCPKIMVLTAAIPENLGSNVQRAKKGSCYICIPDSAQKLGF
jgi:hypothetical protein